MTKEVKERIYFDLGKEKAEVRERVLELINLANKKEVGGDVNLSTLVSFAVGNLKKANIEAIQKSTLSDWDLLKIDHKNWMDKSGEKVPLEEYLVKKLKIQ